MSQENTVKVSNIIKMDQQRCFQFKAGFSHCTIFQLLYYDLEKLEQQLIETMTRAPTFFQDTPVILDVEKVKYEDQLDFAKLKQLLLAHHMVPVGVRNGTEKQQKLALLAGLPTINASKSDVTHLMATTPTEKKLPVSNKTKLITSPIRSGMQVYAKEGDLVVVGQVSPGAELMADGHIHIYGPLRGRALAGVQGNLQARIFCQRLEAELVSIAGYYTTKEDLQHHQHEGVIQIYLDNEQIRIETL